MSKATEDALATLHGAVAVALTGAVQGVNTEEGFIPPSAAHIMAAITFLKNNGITADASSNAALSELNEALARRRANSKSRLSKSVLEKVADDLDRDLGGHLQ